MDGVRFGDRSGRGGKLATIKASFTDGIIGNVFPALKFRLLPICHAMHDFAAKNQSYARVPWQIRRSGVLHDVSGWINRWIESLYTLQYYCCRWRVQDTMSNNYTIVGAVTTHWAVALSASRWILLLLVMLTTHGIVGPLLSDCIVFVASDVDDTLMSWQHRKPICTIVGEWCWQHTSRRWWI
jgi:hypothetical protein